MANQPYWPEYRLIKWDELLRNVEIITLECAVALGKGLGDKPWTTEAVECWRTWIMHRIARALHKGHRWAVDRDAILEHAKKLGQTAAEIAQREGSDVVDDSHAREAAQQLFASGNCGDYCQP